MACAGDGKVTSSSQLVIVTSPAEADEAAHLLSVRRMRVGPDVVENLLPCAVVGQPHHRDEFADTFLDVRIDRGTAVQVEQCVSVFMRHDVAEPSGAQTCLDLDAGRP